VNPARSKKPPSPQTLDDIFHDCDVMTVVQPVLWWLGTYLRFKAILNDEYREPIAARVEVVTPITDFARVREGAFLWMHGGPCAKVCACHGISRAISWHLCYSFACSLSRAVLLPFAFLFRFLFRLLFRLLALCFAMCGRLTFRLMHFCPSGARRCFAVCGGHFALGT